MANPFFRFKQFTVRQHASAMKVCTDASLFGAWCAAQLQGETAQTALDIGTGTGLLSLMLRQKANLEIDAIEIDAAAALEAGQNMATSPWPDAINVIHNDVTTMGFLKSYDCIISNPPFYEGDLQSPDSRRNTALHSGQLTLQTLLAIIAKNITEGGVFFVLLPFRRRNELHQLLQQEKLFLHKEVLVQQTAKKAPFRIMLQGGKQARIAETTTIAITNAAQQYTPAFSALLKDYYLYL